MVTTGPMLRRWLIAATALTAGGCASSGRVLPPSGNTAYGVYHFRETLTSAHPPLVLEGDVLLLPDSVSISMTRNTCAYHTTSRGNTRTINYQCGEYAFEFNRLNPLRENRYAVPTIVYTVQRVCAQSRVDANGREVCVRTRDERVERRTMLTGRLTFILK